MVDTFQVFFGSMYLIVKHLIFFKAKKCQPSLKKNDYPQSYLKNKSVRR